MSGIEIVLEYLPKGIRKIVEGTLTEVNGRYTRSGTGEVL